MRAYAIYGVVLETDFEFQNRLIPAEPDSADVVFVSQDHAPEVPDLAEESPVFATGDRGDGRPSFAVFRTDRLDLVRVGNVADFYAYRDRIVCHVLDPEVDHMIEILLLGTVLAYWMERRGVLALHASSVAVDDHAIGIAALNGGGKTSLAASLSAAGHPLLTDDILAVTVDDTPPLAHPGYPQMRMWPDLAEHFLAGTNGLAIVHPDYEKLRVPVGEGGLGSFHSESLPFAALYLPRRSDDVSEPAFEQLSPRDALVWLAGVSFIAPIAEGSGMQAERLPRLRRVTETVPVLVMSYPSGLSRLPAVARSLEDHARSLSVQSNSASDGTTRGSNT